MSEIDDLQPHLVVFAPGREGDSDLRVVAAFIRLKLPRITSLFSIKYQHTMQTKSISTNHLDFFFFLSLIKFFILFITSTKEVIYWVLFTCSFVCLFASRITYKMLWVYFPEKNCHRCSS